MIKTLLFILSCFFVGFISAQSSFTKYEKELIRYNDYFINASKKENRLYAHDKFRNLFLEALSKEKSFEFPFDSLEGVSKIFPSDSSFRIFTWQLMESYQKFNYYGFIQLKTGEVINLKEGINNTNDLEYSSFSPDYWFGQIYYNLKEYELDNIKRYLLFGYKQLDASNKVKAVVPLKFLDSGVAFGDEIFEDTLREDSYKTMILHKTAFDSASKLNYDESLNIIIYDHLVDAFLPDSRGNKSKLVKIPDGTYHGYKLDGDKWKFINNVFDKVYDKPPTDKSIIEERRKNGWE